MIFRADNIGEELAERILKSVHEQDRTATYGGVRGGGKPEKRWVRGRRVSAVWKETGAMELRAGRTVDPRRYLDEEYHEHFEKASETGRVVT